jgi:Zn-finger nucleic acid-binding protein
MRSYERSGILIDQCTECRGVFLDRGELDKLIDSEAEHQHAPVAASAQPPPWGSSQPRHEGRRPDDLPYRDDRYSDKRHRDPYRYDDDRRYGKKRKRSFLDELFD